MRLQDWAWLITLSLLWGGSFFFVEIGLDALPPLTIVWARLAGGAVVLALVLRAIPPRRAWPALLVMGVLNNAVPFSVFALAQGQIDSGLAAILNATTPLWGVLVAHLALADERLTWARGLGVLAGFTGVAVMFQGTGTALAQVLCLMAALSYACAGVWGRRFRAMGLRPAQVALGQVTAGLLLMTPLMLSETPWHLPAPPAQIWGALAGLGLLCTAAAYLIYFHLLARAGAVNLLLVTFLIPVSALALGVGILGETISARQMGGLVLIGGGLALAGSHAGSRQGVRGR